MYLWVFPDGAKRWRFIYKRDGKQKNEAFGVYPEVSLKEARAKKTAARKLVRAGKDLSLERKKEKLLAEQNNDNTFESIARQWYEYKKDEWRTRYAQEVITRLENDIFPHIGTYPITEIEPPILLQVIRKIENRGVHELAKRQLQKCGEVFRHAIREGKLKRDPSADIGEALKTVKKKHYACIDTKEIPAFIATVERNDARLYQNTRNALKLRMLTFVRTREMINATWEEIDFDDKMWIIPAERMKMGKEHIVPLSNQAIAILKNQEDIAGHWPLVFPSSVKPRRSMSNNPIIGALKRLGYQGKMTGHGFRSLAMTAIMEELG